jgi:formiminoglutamase
MLVPAQPVVIGFPCDVGVRRNHGRPGAALAPDAIREKLYRLTSWDGPSGVDLAALDLLDLGNVIVSEDLEAAQQQLGAIVATVLHSGAVPLILGGGHETAFGHYLGYAGLDCGIINVDAHLDVRPFPQGAHSGSPFRQALEHAAHPLEPGRYVVVGAQRQSVARAQWQFVQDHQGRVHWLKADTGRGEIVRLFADELDRLGRQGAAILVTVDADAFCQTAVPGCSAPNPAGLEGAAWPALAERAGADPHVRSLEIVEVNPLFDRDQQTARWAALGLRQFLVGLAARRSSEARK